jgi:hypothetical protein
LYQYLHNQVLNHIFSPHDVAIVIGGRIFIVSNISFYLPAVDYNFIQPGSISYNVRATRLLFCAYNLV